MSCFPPRPGSRGAGITVALVSAIGLAAGLTSCGGTTPPGSHAPPSRTAPEYEVSTGSVKGLGTILVDGEGYTLYLFLPDAHSSHSQCSGICAAEWPPLLLPKGIRAPVAGAGAHRDLVGTTARVDGGIQVTYAGWPLYLWPDDVSPGQATGQGLNNVGGLWYVVSPDGTPIRS